MLILGLTKTTLLDYPGHVSATVFTGGCNFRCPFCHNGQMVLNPAGMEKISENEVMEHLSRRKNVLEGVCITGGEPTIHSDLPEFIAKIKELGYLVKLDTNGTHPAMLNELIESSMIDYVAMDIKNSFTKYADTASCNESMLKDIANSIDILLSGKVDYEFRTTVIKELHTEEDFLQIDEMIKGAKRYFIQSYVESDNVIQKRFAAYSKEELEKMVSCMKNVKPVLRGIE